LHCSKTNLGKLGAMQTDYQAMRAGKTDVKPIAGDLNTMTSILFYLALAAMFGVLVVLLLGIFSLVRGGKFRERWSNKLMRLRVLLQAVAITLLCLFAWWASNHSS
jgi:hypothetical protein